MTATYVMPASFAQQRLWLLDRLLPGVPIYNVAQCYRLVGRLDAAVVQRGLDEIERRHEVLRTMLVERDGAPVQAIHGARGAPVEIEDASGVDLSSAASEEASRPFDLANGPLWRVRLLRVNDAEHVLLLTMHHAITDHWSMRVFMDELITLYEAYSSGLESPLPELPVQYADFADWQREWLRGSRLDRQLDYWRRQLADAPPGVELPTDRPRPPMRDYRGGRHAFRLPAELTDGLRALARRTGTTLYMTLVTAFQVLLFRYTGQPDVMIGSPVANRARVQLEPLIGFFVNMLVLRADLRGAPSFERALLRTRELALGAYAHQDVPFERVVEELRPPRSLNRHPFFQVTFQLMNAPSGERRAGALRVASYEPSTVLSRFDLDLTMWERPDGLGGIAVYAAELFDPRTIRRLLRSFETLLAAAVAAPDLPIGSLPLLRRPPLRRRPGRLAPPARGRELLPSVERQFAELAARQAAAPAVLEDGRTWTYGELAGRAGALARRLRGLGLGPEAVAGLRIEPSADLVAAMLAVLETGAAYRLLPEPEPPAGCRLDALLTRESLAAGGPAGDAAAAVPDQSLACVHLEGGQLVMVERRALAHATVAARRRAGIGPGDVVHAPADPARMTRAVWLALTSGAAIAVASGPERVAPEADGAVVAVLDEHLQPVPAGVAGELYLAGPAVPRGYLGDPAATALRFVPDPFGLPGSRMLRTGHLARCRAGRLEDLGPIADQVWWRGQRLELREMERTLRAHPGVRDALLRGHGRQLVAYYVGDPGAAPDPGELHRLLRQTQPEHALPAAWVPIAAVPLTVDGRVDVRALPDPPSRPEEEAGAPTSLTPVEALVAESWRELFGEAWIGPESGFFQLGGHSLLAMREVTRLGDRFGVELSLRDLFADPSVQGIARAIERLIREQVEELSEEAAGAALAAEA